MTAITTFEPEDGKIRYTARALHWTEEARQEHEAMGFYEGWGQSADRFEAVVARLKAEGARGQPTPTKEVTLTRSFNAPRASVWQAWTDLARLAAWWGPASSPTPSAKRTRGPAALSIS